ncbi:MAG: hypothetical protein FJY95_00440 [Candidatus Handelsmanbacteria bacterium]|nr:hypothetical protein [Candidatus Handelsmanbacteria bacterium]
MPTPPPYGIIYNWDGAPHGYGEVPQTLEHFLAKTYAPLERTQVGAHFWCVGEHAARWPSQVLELLGDVHGRRYENAYTYLFTENVRGMLERGEDPQAGVLRRGHELGMQVWASIRMNDNHFNGSQAEDLPTLHHTEMTDLRRQHPEWLLGKQTSEWFALSWNLAIPQIREHRYAHIKEVCRNWAWDGVELDWQRHAFHLPQDQGYRLRYTLTDLQRAVRGLTDELSQQRDRPFYLAARVAGDLDQCLRLGYDVPAWVEEGLVDLIIPAGGAATDPAVDVAGFVTLCHPHDIPVYPGFDGGLPDPFVGPEDNRTKDRMRTRAIASRHWHLGADGIYLFNWHANADSHRDLLTQIGSPRTLARTDKICAATHRFLHHQGEWRGAYDNDRLWGEVPVALKPTRTGCGPTVVMHLADDFASHSPRELLLRIRLEKWVKGDLVRVKWDGTELDNLEQQYCFVNDPHRLSDASSATWLRRPLEPALVKPGPHTIEVILAQRHPQVACDLMLTDVELVVRY